MGGSTFGTIFKITTWGESHGKALGVIIDGCPAGLALSEEDIQPYLNRRKPGKHTIATPRKEMDQVEILSGTFHDITTGSPISLMIKNTNQKSNDYQNISNTYRPGHADYTFDKKYGFYDYRGGGRSSGRETAGRVAAGAIAIKLLNEFGITVCAYTNSIGPIEIDLHNFNKDTILQTPTAMPDAIASKKAEEFLAECMKNKDSAGGTVKCIVSGTPVGLGDPVFEKLDANLSKAIMSIGAVKAVEIGDGIQVSTALGSANNDSYKMCANKIRTTSNHAGGILGGISNAEEIIIKAHFKPTPSIAQTQNTVTRSFDDTQIQINGRHDPIIVPRAVVVVESMVACTILDSLFLNMTSNIDYIKRHIYMLRK